MPDNDIDQTPLLDGSLRSARHRQAQTIFAIAEEHGRNQRRRWTLNVVSTMAMLVLLLTGTWVVAELGFAAPNVIAHYRVRSMARSGDLSRCREELQALAEREPYNNREFNGDLYAMLGFVQSNLSDGGQGPGDEADKSFALAAELGMSERLDRLVEERDVMEPSVSWANERLIASSELGSLDYVNGAFNAVSSVIVPEPTALVCVSVFALATGLMTCRRRRIV